ncbi:MAG: glycosyltransferase family 2 protein [Ignavibacteriaceae bacterium]
MKISIITPSLNQGKFLERTIQSVLSQNVEKLEYILIDGGSIDNTIDIIKKYQNYLAYWISEKDKGQSNAFNKGLDVASGDIIGWINSDDIYYDGAFSESVKIFNESPSVDVVFGDYNFIDEHDNIIKTRKEIPFDYNIYLWTKDCYHANCAAFFRRQCFERVGKLREDLHYGMDYEFYLRLGKINCQFKHTPKILGAYRYHTSSKSVAQLPEMKKEGERIYREYCSDIPGIEKTVNTYYYRAKRIIKKIMRGSYF